MRFLFRCSAGSCWHRARRRCFECDRPLCLAHLVPLRITIASYSGRYLVCNDCLRSYIADPQLRRVVRIEDDADPAALA